MTQPIHIGYLIYPGVTQLDFTGPAQVLSLVPGVTNHMIWKSKEPVMTDAGFAVVPTHTFQDHPTLDVLCLPGGTGQKPHLLDPEVIGWIKRTAAEVRYITSVCTGAFFLGAAGLLQDRKSAVHWAFRDALRAFGAEVVEQRVVVDGTHVSGGGVTAGIDFGLTLAAELAGEDVAKAIQLTVEYDPQPPFNCGTPNTAGPELTERLREQIAGLL